MSVREPTAADYPRMLEILALARADPRYCGNPDAAMPTLAEFTAFLQGKWVSVAVQGGRIVIYLVVWQGAPDRGVIEQFAFDPTEPQIVRYINDDRQAMYLDLLSLGIRTLTSEVGFARDIGFAAMAARGVAVQVGRDPETNRPSGSFTVTIDLETASG